MISSTSNQRVKEVIQLLTSAKARREKQAFIIEGMKLFEEAPAAQIRMVYVSESCYQRMKNKSKLADVPYELVTDTVYQRMSDVKTPQGILCVMEQKKVSLSELLLSYKGQDKHILVLEGIQDPGNLGTMIRTAEGAGISFILADKNTVDVTNPKVLRSTMGAVFRMPVIYVDDLLDALSLLKEEGVTTYAAHLNGNRNFWDEEYAKQTAVLIGNEGNGLSKEVSAVSDVLVKIPMEGAVESLNAAVAASLLMYEIKRRR